MDQQRKPTNTALPPAFWILLAAWTLAITSFSLLNYFNMHLFVWLAGVTCIVSGVSLFRTLSSRLERSQSIVKGSDQHIHSLVQAGSSVILLLSPEADIESFNPEAERVYGYSSAEVIGKNYLEIFVPLEQQQFVQLEFQRVLAGHDTRMFESGVVSRDGSKYTFLWNVISLKGESSRPTGIVVSGQDITERKRIEEALRQEKLYIDKAVDSLNGIFYLFTQEGEFLRWNKNIETITGRSAEEIQASSPLDFFPAGDRALVAARIGEVFTKGESSVEANFLLKDGKTAMFHLTGVLVEIEGRRCQVGMGIDISARKKAEDALRESEQKFARAFQYAPLFMLISKPEDGTLVEVNEMFTRKTGFIPEEVVGRTSIEIGLVTKTARSKLKQEFMDSGCIRDLHMHFFTKSGEMVYCRVNGELITVAGEQLLLIIAEDITLQKQAEEERRKLEAQLRQTQKLEAIGTLAGGIAHDFNNVLFSILGNADLAVSQISDDSPIKENLMEIVIASSRAAELVKQILSFARKGDRKLVYLELSAIVQEVARMLRSTLPATIEINHRFNTAASGIKADPTEIHQVVMNLCTNAGHAMMETGGTIDISLDSLTVTNNELQQHPSFQPGEYLVLSVSDTGPGIHPDIQQRIFEPFFTTKEAGQGTGMGLAVVHGIMQNLGGAVTVYSEVGQGATFKAYFSREAAVSNQLDGETLEIPHGSERLMVVDDEQALVSMLKAMLEKLGYSVQAFSDSQEALAAFLNAPDQFDAVITDQTMPRMTGAELAAKLLEQRPELPIILATGYSHNVSAEKALISGIRAYVNKPIRKLDLATSIRRVLDSE